MTTKKRSDEPKKTATAKRTTKRASPSTETPKRTVARTVTKVPKKPRIHASHSVVGDAPAGEPRKAKPLRTSFRDVRDPRAKRPVERPRTPLRTNTTTPPAARKPLGGPKRAVARKPAPVTTEAAGPGAASRELALTLAAAGIDKKAVGIEILDVTGRVDYADFIVIMTGRSDRHVHAIAMGIEEAMMKHNEPPLSVEGLSQSTWVLIDFSDVVVHVFQEDARALYDIEGLWMDAGRVPVPEEDPSRSEVRRSPDSD